MLTKSIKIGLITFGIILIFTWGYFLLFNRVTTPSKTPPNNPIKITPTKAENCYYQLIRETCPEGANCIKADIEEIFCKCLGGNLNPKTPKYDETQIRKCEIDGKPYTGILYNELKQGWYFGDADSKKEGTPEDWALTDITTKNPKWAEPSTSKNYILEQAEGDCISDNQCQWAGEGCGGGHGVCTNNPNKYKDQITTCEVNDTFPSNRGYTCGCVAEINRCGWKK